MTISEVFERYDDEHLAHLYAIYLLEGIGDDNRRAARIASAVHNSVMNGLRLSGHGHNVDDSAYRTEEDYMPKHSQQRVARRKPQSWKDMSRNLPGA